MATAANSTSNLVHRMGTTTACACKSLCAALPKCSQLSTHSPAHTFSSVGALNARNSEALHKSRPQTFNFCE
eukprot:3291105-Amphidinium_carterae.1